MTNGTPEEERNGRLEALRSAVNEFANREIERLEGEVNFLNSVVEGRTSSGQLTTFNTEQVSALVEEEINAFLAG